MAPGLCQRRFMEPYRWITRHRQRRQEVRTFVLSAGCRLLKACFLIQNVSRLCSDAAVALLSTLTPSPIVAKCRAKIWATAHNFSMVESLRTGHRRNIFHVGFVEQAADRQLVTCAADGCGFQLILGVVPYGTLPNSFHNLPMSTFGLVTVHSGSAISTAPTHLVTCSARVTE